MSLHRVSFLAALTLSLGGAIAFTNSTLLPQAIAQTTEQG